MGSNQKVDLEDLESVLLNCPWILDKVKEDRYAQNLYAAMCNVYWQQLAVIPILQDRVWSCSWRYSGGIIATLRNSGDYMDWYCSGMGEGLGNGDPDGTLGYVPEGTVTDEIQSDLRDIGWFPTSRNE